MPRQILCTVSNYSYVIVHNYVYAGSPVIESNDYGSAGYECILYTVQLICSKCIMFFFVQIYLEVTCSKSSQSKHAFK